MVNIENTAEVHFKWTQRERNNGVPSCVKSKTVHPITVNIFIGDQNDIAKIWFMLIQMVYQDLHLRYKKSHNSYLFKYKY